MLCLLLSLTLIHPVYAAAPAIPTVTSGYEQITISDYDTGATLRVYSSDGGIAWQQTNVTAPSVTLDLLPDLSFYYVTQVVGGLESINTPFFNPSLRTPAATAGIEYIDVSNVSGNTTLELYNASTGALVSTTVSSQGNGVYRFENVVPTTQQYYIIQSINGKQSANTAFLSPSVRVPAAVGGAEYADVSNTSRLVVQGTGAGQFQPQCSITRAEFASILVRGLGLSSKSGPLDSATYRQMPGITML
ncbi:hypothetical protein D3C81_404510 [compost metagenome]